MRRWTISFAALAAAVLAVVLLLPWWLGFAAARVGRPFGLSFQEYRRDGYGEFRLRNVEYHRGGIVVRIDEIAAESPLVWLWHRSIGRPGLVKAGHWSVTVMPASHDRRPKRAPGWVPLRRQLLTIAGRLEFWLPRAEAGPGVVTWKSGELTVASAKWQDGKLGFEGAGIAGINADGQLAFEPRETIRLSAKDADRALVVEARADAAKVSGRVEWLGQPAIVEADFPAEGWEPVHAALAAEQWTIPAERARLGAHYAVLRGDARLAWDGGVLTADVSAESTPRKNTQAPPLMLKLKGRGDAHSFVAEQLQLSLPGATARLSDPVTIDRHGRLLSGTSRFDFEGQLAELPWGQARGAVRGEGRIGPGADGLALVKFSVAGDELVFQQTAIARFEATGQFEWPRVQVEAGTLRAPDGKVLRWRGGWDFRSRSLLNASVNGVLARETVARWLGRGFDFDDLTVEAKAAGAWPDLVHEGKIAARHVQFPKLNPIEAKVSWKGRGLSVEQFALDAAAGRTTLSGGGSATTAALRLDRLAWTHAGEPVLRLAQPAEVRWRPELRVDAVRLTGSQARVEATLNTGAAAKDVDLLVEGIRSEWLRDLVALPKTEWMLNAARLRGTWGGGPADFDADALLGVSLSPTRTAEISMRVKGSEAGLQISSLRVAEGSGGVIVNASGQLPVRIFPGATPLVRIAFDRPFSLEAATNPNPSFWEKLTELTGLEIAQPEAHIALTGTLERPRGEARFRAVRIAAVPDRLTWKLPRIEAIEARVSAGDDGIRLNTLSAAIEGQTVKADGWLPVAASHWRDFMEDPRGTVRRADLHLQVPDADLAAIARYVPAYLAPKGRLQLDLTLKSDQTIAGFLRVQGAASRPLGPLGVLQDVAADIGFDGRAVVLKQVTARMGGQIVALRGRAELPPDGTPRLDFTLKGENLPFVRRTGLLLRGDLDLTLKTENDHTTIGGETRLRDSLFLSDLGSLLPSGTKAAERRPPYFAIDFEPLNQWRLDVQVHGEKFFRLRTPVFNGTASANVRLGGTLGNPRATGQAVIDEGNIRLPFASFEIRQGEVRLTPDQPEPQLMVIGTTRRYGYDLRLELSGPASAPNLTFSSSPPLEAEQVLLMVMAGQAPHNEVTTTDRQRVARFGAFFGQSLLGTLGGGDAGGADRLTISSGENISTQGHETYTIEYRLSDRWALTGEYDEFDQYYGGLKWRIYQRGGKQSDEKK